MYYSEDELERMRKQGEEYLKQEEERTRGNSYLSEAGIEITCTHCTYDRFEQGKALLNTRGMTFFDLDWLNPNATILICKRCGYIHWFNMTVTEK